MEIRPDITSNDFFEIPQYSHKPVSFNDRIQILKARMQEAHQTNTPRSSVVILGGGPAGLMRAVVSLANVNPTQVIEKRDENTKGRENIVTLLEESFELLNTYGVLAYLHEHKMIKEEKSQRPYTGLTAIEVRIGDLEEAMKAIIHELNPNTICYSTKVISWKSDHGKAISLIAKSGDNEITIDNVDLLVIAEGAKSPTNRKVRP